MKNAKKILSILLCLLMLLTLASCKKEEAKTEEDGEKDGTAAAIAFSITANGTTIELGKDATPVLTALGAPMAQSSVGNCGGKAGTWTRYTYAGFYLLVLENGDQQTVDQIELKDDSILTAKGVGIGSTRDDVLKAAAVEVAVVRVVPYRFEMYDTDFVKQGYDVRQIIDKEA